MNIKRFLKQFITNPNSSEGLIMRAEVLEEKAEKIDGKWRKNYLLYARILREISLKNLSPKENLHLVSNYLRRERNLG